MSQPVGMTARVEGLDDALRALRRLDKEAQRELRTGVQKLADRHADALRAAGRSHWDPRVRHVATQIRARKDRLPTVAIGMAGRFDGRGNARGVDLVYGTEFGAGGRSWWRFEPGADPWIFPTLAKRHRQLVSDYEQLVDRALKSWSR